jgi:ribonuclease HI
MIQAIDTPIILFDGASVSNPGVAAAAAVVLLPNGRRYTVSQFLSFATDQEAKYTGLIIGLRKAKQLGLKTLEIKGESDLIFNQVNGLEPVTDKALHKLYQEVQKLLLSFIDVNLECIPREQNRPAVAAVNRCIGEALGRESKPANTTPTPTVNPKITQLLKLGSQATETDYQNLETAIDDYTFKPLPELRALIAESVQDTIALQWNGNENHLAEIYRWVLRGLSPLMAVRKVQIDYPEPVAEIEKLPWEGELIAPEGTVELEMEIAEPFFSVGSLETPEDNGLPSLAERIAQKETLINFALPTERPPPPPRKKLMMMMGVRIPFPLPPRWKPF